MIKLAERTITLLAETRLWRLRTIGQLNLLPSTTRDMLRAATTATARVRGPVVNLALGYSGRSDIIHAIRSLLLSRAAHGLTVEQIAETLTQERIRGHLWTGDQPDIDLVVRTSGEERLSGFMTWQTANAELYFPPTLWPDFDEQDFAAAIAAYGNRDRRFGL